MLVKHAKTIARCWVNEVASQLPGFRGAFFHGSINWLQDESVLPATSDVDLMVVVDESVLPEKLGKILFEGVILEISYLAEDQIESPERILGQYHIAGSFHSSSVILDLTGRITTIQNAVTRNYAKRQWVYARCEHARDKVLSGYGVNPTDPFHDQVTAWLFSTGITTHILLVAGLKNPTVRLRYLAARELLTEYGRSDFYEPLIELLGCAQMTNSDVERHLTALAGAFDAAKSLIKTPFFFAADISDIGRPIAIDGSRQLIERGDHREAIFWIVATFARCRKVLATDAPAELRNAFDRDFRRLLGELGIRSSADLQQRLDHVRSFVPRVWEVAEAIIEANPDIEDDLDLPAQIGNGAL